MWRHDLGLLAATLVVVSACSGAVAPSTTPVPAAPSTTATARPLTSAPASPSTTAPPTATATESASPSPSPTPSPSPSPSPSPTVDPTAWATEVCSINNDFLRGSQTITVEIPAPADATVAAVKAMHERRRPRIEAITVDALRRLDDLEPIQDGAPFQDALVAEFTNQQTTSAAFYAAIADAASLAEIDQAIRDQGAGNLPFLTESSRAVSEIPLLIADAIAAIEGCRFFEFDARARLRGAVTPTFSTIVIDDSFDAPGFWKIGPFDGGSVAIDGGKLSIAFAGNGGMHTVTTSGHEQTAFGDVRLETEYGVDDFALSGLACRSTGGAFYTVQVNPLGLVLIYRWAPRQTIIGRRTAPRGAVEAERIQLAIECAGGRDGEPLVIAVYLDGERVAEVVDERPLAPQGLAGMFAQSVGRPSTTSYEDITILVPAE